MNQPFLMIAAVAAVASTVFSGETLSVPPNELVVIEVEGRLGMVHRTRPFSPDEPVKASVMAGGGELFLDTRHNKTASDMLTNWYDGLPKLPSVIPEMPRVKIAGRLEYLVVERDDSTAASPPGSDADILRGRQSGWVVVVDKFELLDQ